MSQQKKIEEQRTLIAHLRQQLKKEEKTIEKCELIAKSRVPTFENSTINWDNTRQARNISEKLSEVADPPDSESDSAINTDSGSEAGKLSEETDPVLVETIPSQTFTYKKPRKLSRSLSDLCQRNQESYLRTEPTLPTNPPHAMYANHRSVQRPRDVKNRHWRKSIAAFVTTREKK